MKIKLPELDNFNKGEDPFKDCKLNRKKYAEILTSIISKYADGFVMALNNEWGTGKTTFVKMWKQQLENEGFKTLFYNAWENDFENDVLIALISELNILDETKDKQTFKNLQNKAAPLVKSFVFGLIKTAIKKYAGEDFIGQALENTTETFEDEIQEQIDSYLKRKNGVTEFKKSLEEFVKDNSNDKPVIFFIDELDRCRPHYAVEVLEVVKHLFSVSGIVFVLSIDKVQLEHAIRGFYGSENIDAKEYLRRFIDIEYSLPEPETHLFCSYLYEDFGFDEFLELSLRVESRELLSDKDTLIKFSSILFENMHLTLRMQEKIFGHARLALLMFQENNYLFPDIFIFLITIKENKNWLYQKIIKQAFSLQELIDELDNVFTGYTKTISSKEYLNWIINIEAYILTFYHNDINSREKLWVQGEGVDVKLSVTTKIKADDKLDFMVDHIRKHTRFSHIGLSYLTNKINLLDSVKL